MNRVQAHIYFQGSQLILFVSYFIEQASPIKPIFTQNGFEGKMPYFNCSSNLPISANRWCTKKKYHQKTYSHDPSHDFILSQSTQQWGKRPLHNEGRSFLINTFSCVSLSDVGFHGLQDPFFGHYNPPLLWAHASSHVGPTLPTRAWF